MTNDLTRDQFTAMFGADAALHAETNAVAGALNDISQTVAGGRIFERHQGVYAVHPAASMIIGQVPEMRAIVQDQANMDALNRMQTA